MRKIITLLLTALLLLGTLTACKRNVPKPIEPSASPGMNNSASPGVTDSAMPDRSPDAAATDAPSRDGSYREYEITYPSRGVNVHATVVLPGRSMFAGASASPDATAGAGMNVSPNASGSPNATAGAGMNASPNASGSPDATAGAGMNASSEPVDTTAMPDAGWPLVVFLHGHGGERNENGGFTTISHELAKYGIASVRMDFAGSGESEEPFTDNSLTSMYTDVLGAIDFMKATYPVDENAIGVFGFDMGGRVALHLLALHLFDFRAVVLLAPTNNNSDLIGMFGGQEEWDRYKMDAELNNYTTFTTVLGQVQDLSVQWFSDLEASDDPAKLAEQSFQNRALVIYATNDTTVSPEVSRYVAEKLGAETLLLETGGHSYGFYAESEELLTRVAQTSAEFFYNALRN